MKRKVVLLAALALGGCMQHQAKDVAACQAEADRFYRDESNTFDAYSPRDKYIIGCMAAKGYNFDISPADCDSRRPLSTQPTCYTSNGLLAWIIDKFGAN